MDQTVHKIRSRICDGALIALSIVGALGLAASLYRAITFGWLAPMTLQVVLVALLWGLTFFRRAVPYAIKASFIVITMFLIAVLGVFVLGLVSGAVVGLIVPGLLASIFFSRRTGILVGLGTWFSLVFIAVYTVQTGRLPDIDVQAYLISGSAWGGFLGGVLFYGMGGVVIIAYINQNLISALTRSQENAQALEKSNQELQRARDQADQANRAKSEFLSHMSHEIRTPMNGVVGMVDVLSHSRLSDDDRKMVTSIRHSADSLLAIINDILDFSKIEAGKMALSEEPMRLEDEFDAVTNLLDRVALDQDVELTAFFDPDIPDSLVGDALRLRQILTNLTGNALKFSSGLDRLGRVQIRAELERREEKRIWVRFMVKDNGIGIDEKTQARLFQSFEQADKGTTRIYGGTGLGLVISQQLARLMGGNIDVESKQGVGSAFTLSLPFSAGEAKSTTTIDASLEGIDVIVVGDDPVIAEDYSRYLQHADANVYMEDEIGSAKKLIGEHSLTEPICMLVLGEPGQTSAQEIVDRLAAHEAEKDVRIVVKLSYLSVARGGRRNVRPLADNVFEIDRGALTRQHLLQAVVRAVGREKVETPEQGIEKRSKVEKLQSRQEAIASGRLILVAEDNPTNRDVIARQLELLGFTGDIAEDGIEAYDMWQSGDYGLVLTDLHMPRMDGYDLTSHIRRDEQKFGKSPITIIALTANAMKGEEENCRKIGMDDYLSKPCELELLKNTLRSYLPKLDAASD